MSLTKWIRLEVCAHPLTVSATAPGIGAWWWGRGSTAAAIESHTQLEDATKRKLGKCLRSAMNVKLCLAASNLS